MKDLPIPLKVAIVDADVMSANVLKVIIETKEGVTKSKVFGKVASVGSLFSSEQFNSLFIDIFSFEVGDAVDFIERVRKVYPMIPICLYSLSSMFERMPGVSKSWEERFGHYFKLEKDQNIQALSISIEETIYFLSSWIQTRLDDSRTEEVKSRIEKSPQQIDDEQLREDVASFQELLSTYRKTLISLIKQQAMQGNAFVAPNVNHGIQDARKHIRYIKSALRKWGVGVQDYPYDDEDPT